MYFPDDCESLTVRLLELPEQPPSTAAEVAAAPVVASSSSSPQQHQHPDTNNHHHHDVMSSALPLQAILFKETFAGRSEIEPVEAERDGLQPPHHAETKAAVGQDEGATIGEEDNVDEFGMPIVLARPPNMVYERLLPIEKAKWMVPHSVYDLDHIDPIELVAEYSNDETMSVDLIATRMALLGIFRKSDTDGGGTLSSEEFQVV